MWSLEKNIERTIGTNVGKCAKLTSNESYNSTKFLKQYFKKPVTFTTNPIFHCKRSLHYICNELNITCYTGYTPNLKDIVLKIFHIGDRC